MAKTCWAPGCWVAGRLQARPRSTSMACSTRSMAWMVRPSIGFLGAFALGTTATLKPSLAASLPLLAARRRAHLASQADLAEGDETLGQRPPTQAALDREQHGQVGRRLGDAHAADGIDEHVLVARGHARVAVQHGQQHGQAVAVQADGQPPRAHAAAVHQGLQLHQQRPRAFQGDEHAAARHRLGMGAQEDRARVGHALQALLGHREDADLVDRAESVLDRPHQPEAAVRVALEVQHRVDDVLQHARAGQRAFLRDVAHEHHRAAARLGRARELRRAFAHMRDRAGR